MNCFICGKKLIQEKERVAFIEDRRDGSRSYFCEDCLTDILVDKIFERKKILLRKF